MPVNETPSLEDSLLLDRAIEPLLTLEDCSPSHYRKVQTESLDFLEPINGPRLRSTQAQLNDQKKFLFGYTGHTATKISTTLISGVGIGVTASLLQYLIDEGVKLRNGLLQHYASGPQGDSNRMKLWRVFGAQLSLSLCCVLLAAALVQIIAPKAAGAGVTLVMALLNGVFIPGLLSPSTFIVKFTGTILARIAGFALGQEGPMIHLGAALASMTCSLETKIYSVWRRILHTEHEDHHRALLFSNEDHREIVSAGAAAGLAAAFGAPVGGVLFALEEASTVWSKKTAWRCFLCAATASFVLNQLRPHSGAGLLSIGRLIYPLTSWQWLMQLPLLIIVSAVGGIAGALFNLMRRKLWVLRASSSRHFLRVSECALVAFLTTVLFIVVSVEVGQCLPVSEGWNPKDTVQLHCDEGRYNDVATALFGDSTTVIKSILGMGSELEPINQICSLAVPCYYSAQALAAVALSYLALMTLSANLAVPGGLFMPSLLIGGSLGALCGIIFREVLPESWDLQPGVFAVAAATATLGAVFRSSISLVVIIVEGTRGIEFLTGVIVACIVSNYLANYLNADGVYESEMERIGDVVYLRHEPSFALRGRSAADIMASGVICFDLVMPIDDIKHILSSTTHNGFPIVSNGQNARSAGRLEGLLLRSQLEVLLDDEQSYCDREGRYIEAPIEMTIDDFESDLDARMKESLLRGDSPSATLKDLSALDQGAMEGKYLNLAPFMNRCPISVRTETPATICHHLFLALSLRHLCVVDSKNAVLGIITRKDLDHASGVGAWRVNEVAPTPKHKYDDLQAHTRLEKRNLKDCSKDGCRGESSWRQMDEGSQPVGKAAGTPSLTQENIAVHDGQTQQHFNTDVYSDIDMDPEESIAGWSVWEENKNSEERQEAPLPMAATSNVAVAPGTSGNTDKHTVIETAGEAAVAEDPEEAQVLAATTAAGNPAVKEIPKHVWRRDKHGHMKKKKQPLVTRVIDRWFYSPFLSKYETLGYMVYKGFNKAGMRMERAGLCISENMNGAIRDAGLEAVDRLERFIIRKYLRFFITWAVLTFVLVPLPSMHISLTMG